MSGARDLTRWNRAGLSRFRYLDANAAGHLEDLRRVLVARFPRWTDLGGIPPENEPDAIRLARLLAQYFEEEPEGSTTGGRPRDAVIRLRRDPAWQIARAAARAVHVVGEHLDAYANEGFLRTAAEREHLRRLIALLDFHPAPPASAAAVLVLTAKGPGTVEAGFPVQHVPAAGGPPVVFETREAVEIDPALNAVRLAGWNRSEEKLPPPAPPATPESPGDTDAQIRSSPWVAPEGSPISAGQLALLVRRPAPPATEEAAVVTIGRADPATRRFALEVVLGQPATSDWTKGETSLLARPQRVARPRLNGPGVVAFGTPHDLAVGDVVAWLFNQAWHFAAVLEADERAVRLPEPDLPMPGVEVVRSVPSRRSPEEIFLPLLFQAAAKRTDTGALELLGVDDKEASPPAPAPQTHWRISVAEIREVHFVPTAPRVVGKVVAPVADELLFDGKPGELAAGQWTVGDDGGGLRALRIDRIREREDHYAVKLTPSVARLLRLHALFADTLRPEGHDRSARRLDGDEIALDLPSMGGALPPLLARGRELVLEREAGQGFAGARRARVLAVVAGAVPTITVTPPVLAAEGFVAGTTVLRANLAPAGHGEAQPEKVLGSGDPTRAGQTFVLEAPDVSFVADPTQPTGVRADVAVEVEEETWAQVASLRDARPTDPHYTVRQTEEGNLAFGFGDGRNGRRLPAGADNVRIRFRAGVGLAGNLPPGSLVAPKLPHRLVEAVRQPLAATGGNDREPLESLRTNAPASVLTLDRAASVADLTHLAARQASVWAARAFLVPTAPRLQASIEVVVVPAGGGPLGELAVTLGDALQAHAPPGVTIEVLDFQSRTFTLAVTVQVASSRFNRDETRERVRAALLDAFFLRRRGLGQDLFLSEVIEVVEGVVGVESSVSVLNRQPGLRRLAAGDRDVHHLVPASLTVEAREHEL